MIKSGRLTLGEPCAPYKVTKYTIVDGEVKKTEMKVDGRKIPLLDIIICIHYFWITLLSY